MHAINKKVSQFVRIKGTIKVYIFINIRAIFSWMYKVVIQPLQQPQDIASILYCIAIANSMLFFSIYRTSIIVLMIKYPLKNMKGNIFLKYPKFKNNSSRIYLDNEQRVQNWTSSDFCSYSITWQRPRTHRNEEITIIPSISNSIALQYMLTCNRMPEWNVIMNVLMKCYHDMALK